MRKLMLILLVLSPLLTTEAKASGARLPNPPPPMELCGSSLDGDFLFCNDPRLQEADQNYKRALMKGDLCTNSDDYKELEKHDIELRQKIAKLEKNCKQ